MLIALIELKPIFLQATANLEPTSVVKTEYSTFTYFVTSLIGGSTVTKTDIIVSSNVVTEAQYPEPTPTFEVSGAKNTKRCLGKKFVAW